MNNTFSLEQIGKTGDLNADLMMRQYKMDKMAKITETKSVNPKLKQSEIPKELPKSISTLQRCRRERNMHSPYRILQSSNTNTRKQKTSNHIETTSHDLKITSNDLKLTSKEPVKIMRNKLKGGNPSNIHISGKDLIEKSFSQKIKKLSTSSFFAEDGICNTYNCINKYIQLYEYLHQGIFTLI